MKRTFLFALAMLILSACTPAEDMEEAWGDSEPGFEVVEVLEQSCELDSDCETPFDYAAQSSCPFEARCLEKKCSVVCPYPTFEEVYVPATAVIKDVEWEVIKKAIQDCEVGAVFQAHDLTVSVNLKDGAVMEGVEPNIDDILDVTEDAKAECGDVIMATE